MSVEISVGDTQRRDLSGSLLPTLPTTREDVSALYFSPEALEGFAIQYPQLSEADIRRVISRFEELAATATIFTFFPPLITGALRKEERLRGPTDSGKPPADLWK